MEEQMLKIIKSHNGFESWQRNSAKEITSHVMEFITWLMWKDHPFCIEGDEEGNPIWGKYDKNFNRIGNFLGINEIYQYWLTNISDTKAI